MLRERISYFENLGSASRNMERSSALQKVLIAELTKIKRPLDSANCYDTVRDPTSVSRHCSDNLDYNQKSKSLPRPTPKPRLARCSHIKKTSQSFNKDFATSYKSNSRLQTDVTNEITKILSEGPTLRGILKGASQNQQDSISHKPKRSISFMSTGPPNPAVEDIFGLNEFDEDGEDNYIVEAYNKFGDELTIVSFEVQRKSIKIDNGLNPDIADNEFKDVLDLINDSDIVYHENLSGGHQYESLQVIKDNVHSDDEGLPEDEVRNSSQYLSPSKFVLSASSSDASSGDEDNYYYYQKMPKFKPPKINNVLDTNGNIRIQRQKPTIETPQEDKKDKISYVLEELLRTEEKYVTGLQKIVEEYKPYVQANAPGSLRKTACLLFGNIDAIYDKALEFLAKLKTTIEDPKMRDKVEAVAKIFMCSEDMFHLYPRYSKNKARADVFMRGCEDIIKEKQGMLGDKLDLTSYLLTPIQRLGKYVLMLENIQKELTKKGSPSENVTTAISIIKKVMRKGNDSIAIDSIKNSPIDLSTQGSFVMREIFVVHKPKKLQSMVFLFENTIVFTERIEKNYEEFSYVTSIELSDLSIATYEFDPLVFHLTNYPLAKKLNSDKFTWVLEAKNSKIKNTWTSTIESRLWDQLAQAREKQRLLMDDVGAPRPKTKVKVKRETSLKSAKKLNWSKSVFYSDDN